MHIAVDLDGTVALSEPGFMAAFERAVGRERLVSGFEQIYSYVTRFQLSSEEWREIYFSCAAEVYRTAPPVTEAADVLRSWWSAGVTLTYCTLREPEFRTVTLEWLRRHDFPLEGVRLVHATDKLASCRELKVDVLIEDSWEQARRVAAGGVAVWLIEHPHNSHHRLLPGMLRFRGWREIDAWLRRDTEGP